MIKRLFLKVTNDKYELPLVVADSAAELAKRTGTTQTNIYSAISHTKTRGGWSCYKIVEIDEDEID